MKRSTEFQNAKKKSALLQAFGVGIWIMVLLCLERQRPLRSAVESKNQRLGRNAVIAGLGGLALQCMESPMIGSLSRHVEKRQLGILSCLKSNRPLYLLAAACTLDYTLYVWHVLAHKVPLLWRFHVVHHADLDLDVSTALRFHFGELAISVLWRMAQVRILGISPQALSLWQALLMASILFHHSNVRLPWRLERWLNWIIVTPRMHAIHHSMIEAETDANWSSGLTIWDRLHNTYRFDIAHDEVTIGVPAYRRPDEVALSKMLALPFIQGWFRA